MTKSSLQTVKITGFFSNKMEICSKYFYCAKHELLKLERDPLVWFLSSENDLTVPLENPRPGTGRQILGRDNTEGNSLDHANLEESQQQAI